MKWNTPIDPLHEPAKSTLKKKKDPDEPESMLDKYTKLKELYENLRPLDVKFTLEHDEWKWKIDKEIEDKHLMSQHELKQKRSD